MNEIELLAPFGSFDAIKVGSKWCKCCVSRRERLCQSTCVTHREELIEAVNMLI
ncbi:MAG: hypothetical protein ACLTK8_00570 [Paeniclostridium sp.]